MKNLKKTLTFISLLIGFGITNAQFIGSGSQADSITVNEIKNNALRLAWNEQKIKVKGFIIEQYEEDYFWFEDKSGRIKIEIASKYIPNVPFNQNTELVIFGEVCYPIFGKTYIEVKKIEFSEK